MDQDNFIGKEYLFRDGKHHLKIISWEPKHIWFGILTPAFRCISIYSNIPFDSITPNSWVREEDLASLWVEKTQASMVLYGSK